MSLIAGLGPAALLAVFAVYFVAGAVKGVLGFALPLVSVALLPFLVPVETALALNGVVLFFTNLVQIRAAGDSAAAAGRAWPVVAGMIPAVPVGTLLVTSIAPATLSILLGAFILIFAALSLTKPNLRTPETRRVPIGLATGGVSGVVGALTSAPGPIFVGYVVSLSLPRALYMGTLGCIMASFGLILSLSFWSAGAVGRTELLLGLLSVAPASLGFLAGNRIGDRIPAESFRRLVLAALALLACLMIQRGLAG
ncbi:MAG: sulfite exporter TauE/SafE family protein [Pseudomonadota bacterium]